MSPSGTQPIKVLIVDDQRTFGEALGLALAHDSDIKVIDVVTDGKAAVASAAKRTPDVVIMDLSMPGIDGIESTRRLLEVAPDARVLLLTGKPGDLTMARAIQAGATGYLAKTEAVTDLAGTVRRARRGDPVMDEERVEGALRRLRHRRVQEGSMEQRLERLTPRELEILQLLADGMTGDQISKQLGVSPHTLRTHTQNVLMKLKVHSKLEAVVVAIRHGKVVANLEAPSEDVVIVVDEEEEVETPKS